MNPSGALAEIVRELSEIPFLRIAIILAGAWLLVRIVALLLPKVAEALPAGLRVRVLPVVPVLRLFIGAVAVLWVIPLVISPTPQNVVALLGAMGIAVGFALKDYVSSLVAGVVAVWETPYRPGDWVRIGDVYGEVRSVGLRSIRLVTPSDDVVTVPHGTLWTDPVINANDGERTLMVVCDVWLEPDHDGAAVIGRLYEVAWTSPWLDVDRPVRVLASEEPWGTRYRVKAYPLDARDQFTFRSDLTVRGKAALQALGVRHAAVPLGASPTEVVGRR